MKSFILYKVEEMEDLIANGIRNCARTIDEILQNAESDDNYNETMEEFDKANGDEYDGVKYGNNNYKKPLE